jgi:hypothetical protein
MRLIIKIKYIRLENKNKKEITEKKIKKIKVEYDRKEKKERPEVGTD